jgi:hypothetical protein
MANSVVTIHLVDNKNNRRKRDKSISYTEKPQARLSIKKGHKIEWRCDRPFAIHIGNISPLKKNRYRANSKPKGSKYYSIQAKAERKNFLRRDEKKREVKYSVAVYDETTGIWTDDPSMIIEP